MSPDCRSTTQHERRPDMTMTAPKTSSSRDAKGKKPAKGAAAPKASSRADRTYDAIIVGGGHNGLVNAAYLAKSGLKVLILERRHLVGGAAITEELRPGFHFTTFSYALSLLRPDIIHELELTKHGFMPLLMSTTFAPGEDGDYLLFTQDHGQNLKEIARHSQHDADAYDQYSHDVEMVCQAIKPLLDQVPPDIFSDDPEELLALARLGNRFKKLDKRVLHNAIRLLTGSAADFLDDYFESDLIKGYLASSSIIGTKVGPRSQGSGLVLLYHSLGEHDGEFGSWAFHKGGNGGFTQVLARAAQSFGVEIKLEAPVSAVITKDGRATGVALDDGTEFYADTVVSALDPRRTFLELVEPRELPDDLVENIQRFRFQGTSSKVNFALDGLPHFPALGQKPDHFRGFTNIGPSMDYLERAYDEAKYGWYSSRPYIDMAVQSTIDADMAPPGKHVMSCFIQYTPYQLRESDWDTEKENLGDTVQRTLESFFPGFGDLVLQREVVTPLHIERTVGLSEGNIFAGEFLAPQMYFFRPAPGWSQYRTPIDGYYQCGSGTHPGGCVMGAPGKLAAGQVIKDRAKAGSKAKGR
jgi:phytoene dehydrogenase-like protein